MARHGRADAEVIVDYTDRHDGWYDLVGDVAAEIYLVNGAVAFEAKSADTSPHPLFAWPHSAYERYVADLGVAPPSDPEMAKGAARAADLAWVRAIAPAGELAKSSLHPMDEGFRTAVQEVVTRAHPRQPDFWAAVESRAMSYWATGTDDSPHLSTFQRVARDLLDRVGAWADGAIGGHLSEATVEVNMARNEYAIRHALISVAVPFDRAVAQLAGATPRELTAEDRELLARGVPEPLAPQLETAPAPGADRVSWTKRGTTFVESAAPPPSATTAAHARFNGLAGGSSTSRR